MLLARGSAVSLTQPWQPLGPAQVSTFAYGKVTGRVSSLAADPSDRSGNTVFVGTTGGGVWKSTNAAGSSASVVFAPLTDDLPAFNNGILASLSIGAISVQPGGTGVVLAGTGDPNDALDSYYGSGLLRSTDSGLTWTLIQKSDNSAGGAVSPLYFTGEAFAGFAWSTKTPNLVVAAVSQSAESLLVDAEDYEPSALTLAVAGLYYSTDAGATWLLATMTDGPGQVIQTPSVPFGGHGNPATAVVWNPVRQRFYAAVRFHGYYDSPDGITWTRLANQPGAGLTRTECPANPYGNGSPACPIFRGSLAVQPATGDIFALTVDAYNLDQGLWRDVCSATGEGCVSSTVIFGQQLPSSELEDGNGVITLGDYNLSLAAVPFGGDTMLFAGTTDIYRCTLAANCSWRNTTNTETCAAALVAPAQHAIDTTFSASLSLVFFGNDSGLWRSTDNVNQTQPPCSADDANHFQNLNGGLGSLAEVNGMAQDPTDSTVLLAGLGVNGTAAATSAGQTMWPQILDGYGSYVAVDSANPQNWYAQSSGGVGIDLCTNGSSCTPSRFTPVIGYPQLGGDAYAFSSPAPFLLDPLGSTNMILGTCHVWLGPADGLGWSAANLLGDLYPGEGPQCDGNASVLSLAISGTVYGQPAHTELIYAGMAGAGFDGPQAYSGHLFEAAVSVANPTPGVWTDLRLSPVTNDLKGFNPQDLSVASVTVDTHDATGQTVYATLEGFSTVQNPTSLVYASTNGGASWTNITSNLPDAPANSLVVDPNDANTVYLGMDVGVYVTTAVTTCPIQNCWSVYGTGLPNSPVIRLATFNSGGQSLLRVATYGRGIWQIPLVTAAATATTATVSPASLQFASQQVQTQSGPQIVTVTNTGTIPLVIKQTAVSEDYATVNNCTTAIAVGASCSVSVTFTPTLTGLRTGTLTIYANVAGGQLTVPLSGSGLPPAAIVLLPKAMNFGSGIIGVATASAQNITVSNTGGVPVNLEVPTVTGDFAIVANTCSASLAPNFGCTVALAFTPTVSGSRTGVFSITDSVGTQTATLSGIGVSPATDTVSPTSLIFAAQIVGSSSNSQTVTLTNAGDSTLNLISVATVGDFLAVNGCGTSLIGHSSCAVTVRYVPTQVGPESGSLTVTDIFGRPQSIALTGIGVTPAGVSALPTAISFGNWGVAGTSPAQSVTITDSGGVPLSAMTFVVSGDFAISANSCSPTLVSGANCSVQIAFSPSQSGPRSGTLTIASPTLNKSFQIPLNGSGLGFTFQADGSSSATVAAGQTASYLLQILPSAGSSGTLALTCTAAPSNSVCSVNPASAQIASGVTTTVAVTIATASSTVSSTPDSDRSRLLFCAIFLPISLVVFPLKRPRLSMLIGLLIFLSYFCGCGVTAGVGGSPPVNGNPVSTPPATYAPVITATGPGITQSVKLTLVVD